MGKYVKYLIILFVIMGIIFGINYFLKPSMKDQVKISLKNNGFQNSEYTDLLVKNEDNKKKSFSLADYTYMLEVNENKNGVSTSLNASYDYKEEVVTYSYRVNYSNSVNVLFKGEYKTDNFTCNKEFSTASLTSSEINNICELARININIFDLEAKTLLTKKYVDYIKNK